MLDVTATAFKGRNHVQNTLPGKTKDFMNRGGLFPRLLENYLEKIT